MKVRILPHAGYGGHTWWKVQVESILLRIMFFRVFYWRTVGDYGCCLAAKNVAKEILESEKEFGGAE